MAVVTIASVSAAIAAIVIILQRFLPNAIAWLAVAATRREASAVTISVASRLVETSNWPSFVRADSSASRGVQRGVSVLSWLRPLALICVAIAAVIAPLGLFDKLSTSNELVTVRTSYAADLGPMGRGTPPRLASLRFTRDCNSLYATACPGSSSNITSFSNSTGFGYNVTAEDIDIPASLITLFQSGLAEMSSSISGPFDIQSRFYSTYTDSDIDGGQPFPVAKYKHITSMIHEESYQLVEGLLVDTTGGAIAFRNHTVPENVPLGAVWTEDLLFAEPDTACVNLNLTLEYKSPTTLSSSIGISTISLVDRGGFSALKNKSYAQFPYVAMSDSQNRPSLAERAFAAAFLTNAYSAAVLNVTNLSVYAPNGILIRHAFDFVDSEPGKMFSMSNTTISIDLDSFAPPSTDYSFLLPVGWSNSTISASRGINPWNATRSLFTGINSVCTGQKGTNLGNISTVAVECGILIGAPQTSDGKSIAVDYPHGADLVSPLYSCATGVKLSIKTVTFSYTGSGGISGLQVQAVSPKAYGNNMSKPLWGVENSGLPLSQASPMWGLISAANSNAANISTIRSERLYLPGYTSSLKSIFSSSQRGNLPAVNFFLAALSAAYRGDASTVLSRYTETPDLALLQRWREVSKSASTIGAMINLVWTDLMANTVVGTRGWSSRSSADATTSSKRWAKALVRRDASTPSSHSLEVYPFKQTVGYKWAYAVFPAITLAICIGILGAAIIAGFTRRVGWRPMKNFLQRTSPGRIYTTFLFPGSTRLNDATKVWVDRVGAQKIDLDRAMPDPRSSSEEQVQRSVLIPKS